MHTLLMDLRFAWRLMGKQPGFTGAVVLTLALGIGATTAIVTVADATLVRGLPYPEPERLVQVTMTKTGSLEEMEASYPTFLDWKAQSTAFELLAGYAGGGGVASFGTEPPRAIEGAIVTADFFRTLGVTPALGSDVAAGDEDPADTQVVLVSHGLWQRQFGGDPHVVGTAFSFNGITHTVIGVLPAGFELAPIGPAEIYRPVERLPFQMRRNLHWVNVVGRLRADVTIDEARAEMALISERLADLYPESNRDMGSRIVPLRQAILGDIQPILLLLLAAAGMLLVIACANVTNLLFARSASRHAEMAVRVALGARRSRLVRQSLTEALALSSAGAVAGILVAQWGLAALLAAIPDPLLRFMPYLVDVQVDGRALAFTAGLTVLMSVVFGVASAFQHDHAAAQQALGDSPRTTAGGGATRLRGVLVAGEVALAVILLASAFLTTRSLLRMLDQDPGFEVRGLATLRLLLPPDRYPDAPSMVPALRELQDRLGGLPGVTGVGLTNRAPFQAGNTVRFRLEHEPAASAGEQAEAATRSVDASYFPVLQARLVGGRFFDARDEGDAPPVLVVNRTLAERVFPGQDAVGQRLVFTFAPDQPAREIVGVVDDVREGPLDAVRQPALYNPLMRTGARVVDVLLRTGGDPASHLAAAGHVVTAFDPGIVLLRKTTMDAVVAESPWVFLRRYPATLTSIFAVTALVLAAVGLFGTISYLVTARTREIGIRMALGASPGDVLFLLMWRGLWPALAGIAAGVVGAILLARVAVNLLFGISAGDPLTFVLVPAVAAGVAVLATYVPARRAMRLDPAAAFR